MLKNFNINVKYNFISKNWYTFFSMKSFSKNIELHICSYLYAKVNNCIAYTRINKKYLYNVYQIQILPTIILNPFLKSI